MNGALSPENKVINGLWISPGGKPLSNLERLCLYSFCANGHDFRLWTYGDLPNVPQDTAPGKVEVRDGGEILPKEKIFFIKIPGDSRDGVKVKSPAIFADWFRWELMRKHGGWYADMDMVCLRPLSFADDLVFFRSSDVEIDPALMKFPKGHSFAAAMADACANPNKIVPWDDAQRRKRKFRRRRKFWQSAHEKQGWAESGGPTAFGLAAKHFGIFQDAFPCWQAMFVGYQNASMLFNHDLHDCGILTSLLQNVHAVHFWHSVIHGSNLEVNRQFPPHSPYEVLKRRYLPELQ